ncbi:SIR2 family NAD-dependent protein deacylase [Sporosarcina psychrophila]|uniref:SIR2 family NAD-dependent protein deacylase n=1 Tax=Sporosarcina psychrophila TaxID=1476 RepID=UPI00078D3FE9|nr:SIR2 family protein [Sporosarcina psychrophila]AMQ07109.1 hypothetical protein AZE41_14885 [Sporosarcina psychrophila]
MTKLEKLFKEKLRKYHQLKIIRDRLWSEDGKSRVSVMVGAGFSLNAEKLEDYFASMSTWSDLKNKLAGNLREEDVSACEDVLALGQLYADEFGRANLDELLKEAIPDQNYNPGELHQELLKLPWADVYTTNYDTLLERTLPNVVERSYQVIYDQNDIPSSVAPRIVKLHGSFPSNRPFIFTKKDYDSYEEKSAAFVNMVQQSIMETTLVLIGFSGDDPNFEKWTKWVHENLGEHMPKIYMLTFDESKNVESLIGRGITLIDFKEVYQGSNSENVYAQMFSDIFEFFSFENNKEQMNWPHESYLKSFEDIEQALRLYEKNRKDYPGWCILPDIIKRKNIEVVQLNVNNVMGILNNETSFVEKVAMINELIWIQEIFGIPIDITFHKVMKGIIEEYFQQEIRNLKFKELGLIVLRLIKEARLDFNSEDIGYYTEIMNGNVLDNNTNHQNIYEKALWFINKFDFEKVNEILKSWEITNNDLEWSVKKANLLVEIDESNQAVLLLEDCLNNVRKLITVNRKDLRLLSLEGIILSILVRLTNKYSFKNIKNRLEYLESKHCNPLKEIDSLFSRMRIYEMKSGSFRKKGFDPNRITITENYRSTIEMELIDSYSLLIIAEEWGLALRNVKSSDKEAIKVAIKNSQYLYPFYSWIKYLQVGDLKVINEFFSREVVYQSETESLSLYFLIIMNGIEQRENTNTNLVLLIEIVSRLYFALTEEEKKRVDLLAGKLFIDVEFYNTHRYSIEKAFKPLFTRIIFDKNPNDIKVFLQKIINLPIIGETNSGLETVFVQDHNFFEPTMYFPIEFQNSDNVKISIGKVRLNRLFQLLVKGKSNARDAALVRLLLLLNGNALDRKNEKKLRGILKSIIEDENEDICSYILDSYLIMKFGDLEIQEEYCNEVIVQQIPKSYRAGVISSGVGLDRLLANLNNIFPSLLGKDEIQIKYITNESYEAWLKVFYIWWDDQESFLLEDNRYSFFGKNNDLERMIVFLKNSFLASIPQECISSYDKAKFAEIYKNLLENKLDMALMLIPILLKNNIIKEREVDRIYDAMLNNNEKLSRASISSIYDLALLDSGNQIKVDLSQIKKTIVNLFLFRKESTLLEITKTLKYIIWRVPNFFTVDEYKKMIDSLLLLLDDLINRYYQNSEMKIEEFEILSEATGLAGYIYKQGDSHLRKQLEDWKELSNVNRLPEVRKYAYLFE